MKALEELEDHVLSLDYANGTYPSAVSDPFTDSADLFKLKGFEPLLECVSSQHPGVQAGALGGGPRHTSC